MTEGEYRVALRRAAARGNRIVVERLARAGALLWLGHSLRQGLLRLCARIAEGVVRRRTFRR